MKGYIHSTLLLYLDPLTADTNFNMAERYYTLAEGDDPIENLVLESIEIH